MFVVPLGLIRNLVFLKDNLSPSDPPRLKYQDDFRGRSKTQINQKTPHGTRHRPPQPKHRYIDASLSLSLVHGEHSYITPVLLRYKRLQLLEIYGYTHGIWIWRRRYTVSVYTKAEIIQDSTTFPSSLYLEFSSMKVTSHCVRYTVA
ncbi:hypothetical protein Pelo_17433 [Pelomyxa schiedti]|nr:hypothetical protein Pelo_17433 [Pelomyxa schiedti]